MIKVKEGLAEIYTDKTHQEKISKELEVFYNPLMKTNRDLTITFLKAIKNLKLIKTIKAGLPLGGSGIRAIRFLKETKDLFESIHINDIDKTAIKNIKKNLKLNKIKKKKLIISCDDANLFLLKNKGFNFIDLDPFGSPNKFLDASIKKLSRNGFLAVTATDTAPLAGTFPLTCLWKYWANNYVTSEKHEIGLRILIRKVQLMGSQNEKAMIPVFSYVKDHYYRIIFMCKKGKLKSAKLLKKHGMYMPFYAKEEVGPLWKGELNNNKILKQMIDLSKDHKEFLENLNSEINIVGFINIHEFFKKNKLQGFKHIDIINQLKEKDFKASRTHFSYKGIKTNCPLDKLKKIIKK